MASQNFQGFGSTDISYLLQKFGFVWEFLLGCCFGFKQIFVDVAVC